MRRLWVFGLVVVVLVGVVVPTLAVAGAQSANESSPAEGRTGFAETQFVVTVFENGSVRFTQQYNQPLTNRTEVQRFRAYADRFNTEETPVYVDFKERAMALTAEGSNATGREMEARGFARQARVTSQPAPMGVVEMSFVWTNATVTEDGRVIVGDTFEDGLYLSPEMSLTIETGPELEIAWESVEPNPDAEVDGMVNETDSVTYFGEEQFAAGHPRVAFVPDSAVVVNGSPLFSTPLLWAAGALLVALVLGTVVVRRSETPLLSRTRAHDDTEVDSTTTETAETHQMAAAAEANRGETGSETVTAPRPAVSDEELLSDEDRVLALLEAHGGRMQQGTIVEETGWSKSKVSMCLSEMEDQGQVSKLRIGRENVVSLAGHEPEATRSPFDDG